MKSTLRMLVFVKFVMNSTMWKLVIVLIVQSSSGYLFFIIFVSVETFLGRLLL
jgi:hypothetical protein